MTLKKIKLALFSGEYADWPPVKGAHKKKKGSQVQRVGGGTNITVEKDAIKVS